MKRSVVGNSNKPYDLLIVGGGIYGAAMSYYASLNGLDVALYEKDDFCSHTSANSQKVIHGGLRYLQSFDIKRVLESIRERQRFYAMFPHLLQPLPCVMPVYGFGMKSREAMAAAFMAYRLLQKIAARPGLNCHSDKIPHMLSCEKTLAMFPALKKKNLRGGALWYDALCVEPERVVLSLLKTAFLNGASVANYAQVQKISRIDKATLCVSVKDRLTGEASLVRTRKVALCTGPWFKETFGSAPLPEELEKLTLISGVNSITDTLAGSSASIALRSSNKKDQGLMFVLPWKGQSIAGTVWQDGGDSPLPTTTAIDTAKQLCQDVHDSYSASDAPPPVLKSHFGYVPGRKDPTKPAVDCILSHYALVNLEQSQNPSILQILGVKFTTVFDVSLKALGLLFPEQSFNDGIGETLPCGSFVADPSRSLESLQTLYKEQLPGTTIQNLYGLVGSELLAIIEKYLLPLADPESKNISHNSVLKGMTRFFIEEEMVVSLGDLLWRHLYPGMPGLPNKLQVDIMANEMAWLLGWDDEKKASELEALFSNKETCNVSS